VFGQQHHAAVTARKPFVQLRWPELAARQLLLVDQNVQVGDLLVVDDGIERNTLDRRA
jgi:hypothetical protein